MSDDVEEEGDAETRSLKTRHRWTGTVAAFILLLDLSAVVLVYVTRGDAVPLWVAGAFSLAIGAAIAWTFGGDRLKAAKKALQGGD